LRHCHGLSGWLLLRLGIRLSLCLGLCLSLCLSLSLRLSLSLCGLGLGLCLSLCLRSGDGLLLGLSLRLNSLLNLLAVHQLQLTQLDLHFSRLSSLLLGHGLLTHRLLLILGNKGHGLLLTLMLLEVCLKLLDLLQIMQVLPVMLFVGIGHRAIMRLELMRVGVGVGRLQLRLQRGQLGHDRVELRLRPLQLHCDLGNGAEHRLRDLGLLRLIGSLLLSTQLARVRSLDRVELLHCDLRYRLIVARLLLLLRLHLLLLVLWRL